MTPPSTTAPLGVLSAIPEELAQLDEAAGDTHRIGELAFTRGAIAGRSAVFVECGIGKVNAAIAATLLLTRFDCRALLFCGVAGGLDPAYGVGDVVIGARNLQHDYGTLVAGEIRTYQPGVPWLSGRDRTPGYDLPPDLLARLGTAAEALALPPLPAAVTGAAGRVPRVVLGTILSGDTFLNCDATRQRLHATFDAAAVEMEGGAVAQVCRRFGDVPFVNVRCLSDLAGASSHLDFRTFLPAAAHLAATVTRHAAAAL
ncbi:5'-methylthioadenosine/adenosylhomocysteine nucleosidase [Vineibacter terrae]|uniref:5'-methylthioadenosine/adenosylhomocysteine nucleosidase n=1 Tax=Vineibacter terrae TaxID=2586908 RepID=A0A5C8PK88_9HYPH|nr:5'-methylthioadenosine/adenosylhomocysteine nucleosidase [Vineibacter terrae]TXL73774.1 5'-methylthioadenosine/adenosylhomocysteine nucleosidase [Vineibacter terrae]